MHLYDLPMVFVLAGLAFYVVLGGADFGAGAWNLAAGRGGRATRLREHAHESMAPVWEANHVWLIFVLTVLWTAYPVAFGSIASTLCVALFLAGLGVIVRGAAYPLRGAASSARQVGAVDAAAALASILTLFTLGAAAGGIASRRVPVGNAAGNLVTSWLNPTSILIGVLAIAASGYMAAVFLAADARREGAADLEEAFRRRALAAGAVTGAIAVGGLAVLHSDAYLLYHELVAGDGRVGLAVSAVAGVATLALVLRGRYETARYTAALAVAAIIAGWALAQSPIVLPGLTIREAAAPHDTLVAVVVAVLAGGAILFPSLALLFRLVLGGRLGHGETADHVAVAAPRALLSVSAPGVLARAAAGCLLAGVGFLTIAEAPWAHAIGVVALLACVVLGFLAATPGSVPA